MTTYSIRYRKQYRTGSWQTARRTVRAVDLPAAIARLKADIDKHELSVTVTILDVQERQS